MKRMIIMLLIACSATATISAQQKGKQDNVPYNVKALFHSIITTWGDPNEVYSVNKNPETNQIESSVRITTFSADNDKFPHMAGKTYLNTNGISDAFKKDEPKSYQILHITPGDKKSFSLKAVNENGHSETYQIRNNNEEEMWLMCCKNPQNPKLRDAYAIKWVITKEDTKVNGVIYQITSMRPDLFEKNMSSAGLLSENENTFTIDGRVGYDLTDSLYVVYMADTAEELNNVRDSDFVAYMPVVNKRFSFSVQLDKRKVGRIRTVMPDGSLCHLWTNLDFVPGETYRITTHNGYYDEDRDYEQRVGRYSGKSLLNDLQKRGVDDQSFLVIDTVIMANEVPSNWHKATAVQPQYWRNALNALQQAQLQLKGELVQMNIEKIKANYKAIGAELQGVRDHYKIGTIYERILKQNKELDKKYQDIIKLVQGYAIPATEMQNLYKEILTFNNEQNQGLNEYFKSFGYSREAKPARKLQKYLNDQMEKYIKELEKSLQ